MERRRGCALCAAYSGYDGRCVHPRSPRAAAQPSSVGYTFSPTPTITRAFITLPHGQRFAATALLPLALAKFPSFARSRCAEAFCKRTDEASTCRGAAVLRGVRDSRRARAAH